MFHLHGGPLPFRNRKEFARSQMLDSFIRQPHESMHRNWMEDMWVPMMNRDQWMRNYMGSAATLPGSRFEDLDDVSPPRSRAPEQVYHNSYAKDFRSSGGPDIGYENPYMKDSGRPASSKMSFEGAVAALDEAISIALKFCGKLEADFSKETAEIAAFARPKIIDTLWTMKLEWNGVLACDFARDLEVKAPRDVVTYNAVIKTLLQAIADVRSTDGLRTRDWEDIDLRSLSPESVKTALKKLNITFQGIEELVHTVKAYRERMPALNKELASANSLLAELKDLWMPRKRHERRRRTHDEYWE